MKRGWILVLLLSVGLNLGLGWSAMKRDDGRQRPQFTRGPGVGTGISATDSAAWLEKMEKGSRRLSERMGFEPELGERLHEARMERLPLVRDTRIDVMALRAQMHEACMQEELDEEVVRGLVEELTGAQSRVDSLIAETLISEMSLLTPEQRGRYIKMLDMRRGMPPGFEGDKPPWRGRRGRGGYGAGRGEGRGAGRGDGAVDDGVRGDG